MQPTDLYVGNMPYAVTEDEIRAAFAAHGTVVEIKVILDRDTGKPRGFAFVKMSTLEEAQAAATALADSEFSGRRLKVSIAHGGKGAHGGKKIPRGGGRPGGGHGRGGAPRRDGGGRSTRGGPRRG